MPQLIARILVDGDVGGPSGKILGPGAPTVFAGYFPVSLMGDKVGPHGPSPHTKPTLVGGAFTVLANGKFPSCTVQSIATCGHPVVKGFPRVLVS